MSHFIDKIVYINLDKRQDKHFLIEQELDAMDLEGERFPAIYEPQHGVGCLKSHLGCLKLAKEKGYTNILILEDDFKFLVSKEEFETYISHLFSTFPTFDVCMFAYQVFNYQDIGDIYLKRTLKAQNGAAYLVNCHYYDKLISLFESAVPLLEKTGHHWVYANDSVWQTLQPTDHWYFFIPPIGEQREIINDHANILVSNKSKLL